MGPHPAKKNELKPHLKQQWCIGKITGAFLACMENILYLYGLPYDPAYPLLCFDERPCVLHGQVVEPLVMQPGKAMRYDYEYQRNGTCCLLVAVEPLTGFRLVEVSQQRTQADYTRFMQRLAAHYGQAKQIRLVQDNLNTHQAGSFYSTLAAEEAFALAQRFEFHYTPKKGSWLNMAELEINAIVRQCLGRRIESQQRMAEEVGELVKERNEKQVTINWQFTPTLARQKLARHYEHARSNN